MKPACLFPAGLTAMGSESFWVGWDPQLGLADGACRARACGLDRDPPGLAEVPWSTVWPCRAEGSRVVTVPQPLVLG